MGLHASLAVTARRCLRCKGPAAYFRAAAGVWQGLAITSQGDGAVTPLVPGRVVPLCEECADHFDPRSALPWNAPSWVVSERAGERAARSGADSVLNART
jgi:hypothetical protein